MGAQTHNQRMKASLRFKELVQICKENQATGMVSTCIGCLPDF